MSIAEMATNKPKHHHTRQNKFDNNNKKRNTNNQNTNCLTISENIRHRWETHYNVIWNDVIPFIRFVSLFLTNKYFCAHSASKSGLYPAKLTSNEEIMPTMCVAQRFISIVALLSRVYDYRVVIWLNVKLHNINCESNNWQHFFFDFLLDHSHFLIQRERRIYSVPLWSMPTQKKNRAKKKIQSKAKKKCKALHDVHNQIEGLG